MSSFTTPLSIRPVADIGGKCLWETDRSLTYEIGAKGSGLFIFVPVGYRTDLATIPRLLWPIFPPHDPAYAAAAVLHDFLCTWEVGFERDVADAVFFTAMRVLGVPRWRAWTMYAAVRGFRVLKRLLPK